MDNSKKYYFHLRQFLVLALASSLPGIASAEKLSNQMQQCLINQLQTSSDETTVKEVKNTCEEITELTRQENKASLINSRIAREKSTLANPSVITSHRRNYFLPISYNDNPNIDPFKDLLSDHPIDNLEAKFQLSFKAPIAKNILAKSDLLFFGFTIQSYWQMYNSDLSSPFRETNYQPEIFYVFLNDWEFGDWDNRAIMFGLEHQSNGRTQGFSRSWNRIYANFLLEKENWVVSFRPWYRLPEKEKLDPLQPNGDDNPDIDKFMGNFELTSVYSWDDQNFSIMLRNNLRSKNKGSVQLDWSFPMGKRFKGYIQYFNGYGESLIDYNHSIQRIGFGVLLTDFF